VTLLIDVRAFRDGLRPLEPLTVSEWADRYRKLSSKASAEPGPWKTSRTPYLREVMDVLSAEDPTQRVVFMAGAQVGKTEAGSNWLGYVVHHAPGPMLLVQPTVEMGERLVKQRLNSLIAETPVLAERIANPRSRDSGNTMTSKEFPGGMMLVTGANSATGLRSTPCRYIFADEIDAFPQDVDGEGDPLSLAEKRATTFARRKIFMTSTPTVKGLSRVESEYEISDQRRYFVPCPHCKHKQYLRWANMRWTDDDPYTAAYACESCGTLIEERYKSWMLVNGEWRATAPGDGRTVGFHISSLYSPLGWKSWADCVAEFLRSRKDRAMLKTWVNTTLGETWDDEVGGRVGAEALRDRVEFYRAGRLPEGACVVTMGVDVQDNRLAVSTWAWGHEEEGWLLDHVEIFGDPARPELWKQLDEMLNRPIPREDGPPVRVRVCAIDSGGHFTAEVYQFTRERKHLGVIAVKGQSQRGKPPIGKPAKVDINYKGKSLKKGAEVYPVGSDTVKSTIYGRLRHNEPGPGFLHFHADVPVEYFEQLTSEVQKVRYQRGYPVREWTLKPGQRNEALDCAVYSYSALQLLYTRYARQTFWQQMQEELEAGKMNHSDSEARLQQPRARRTMSTGPSFVTNW
jgi:phage terminase large subunit GpA-like protein